jgi:hypothetical protein
VAADEAGAGQVDAQLDSDANSSQEG